eukprot:scaffold18107_cov120-Skeletonema_menzelii.AAC.1
MSIEIHDDKRKEYLAIHSTDACSAFILHSSPEFPAPSFRWADPPTTQAIFLSYRSIYQYLRPTNSYKIGWVEYS